MRNSVVEEQQTIFRHSGRNLLQSGLDVGDIWIKVKQGKTTACTLRIDQIYSGIARFPATARLSCNPISNILPNCIHFTSKLTKNPLHRLRQLALLFLSSPNHDSADITISPRIISHGVCLRFPYTSLMTWAYSQPPDAAAAVYQQHRASLTTGSIYSIYSHAALPENVLNVLWDMFVNSHIHTDVKMTWTRCIMQCKHSFWRRTKDARRNTDISSLLLIFHYCTRSAHSDVRSWPRSQNFGLGLGLEVLASLNITECLSLL